MGYESIYIELTQGNMSCNIRWKALLVGTDVAKGDGVQVQFLRLAQDISVCI